MKAPPGFRAGQTYASYRLKRQVTFREAIDLIATAISFARENNIRRLFVDSTKLTGFEPPDTVERFRMAVQFASAADSRVKVALLGRAELIDHDRFGVTVARNRGLLVDVFETEADALAWLLDPKGA
ncbi:MAG TPA: hypothetical protein VKF40_09610 [Burkholderiales bacterium]|nr:hypothetical protein [Burkholderiales bacterium]